MKTRLLLGWLCIGFVLHANAQFERLVEVKEQLPDELTSTIDSICQAFSAKHHYPGLAVGVSTSDYDPWLNTYGYAEIGSKTTIDVQKHVFRIGSVSKLITATALAGMVGEGLIDLDVPVSAYYPELPEDQGKLTLRQIAGHTAGIRHYRGFEFYSNLRYTDVFEPLEVFIHDTLLFEPGTRYSYSTYGWTLVSAIMEKAAKKPFLQILYERVNRRLRINTLLPDHKDSTQYHRVTFYAYREGQHVEDAEVDNSNKWAGGGLLCSPEELLYIGEALYSNQLVRPDLLQDFTTSLLLPDGTATNYGVGFRLGSDDGGRKWVGHSGGSIGGTSMLLVFPEYDVAVITLINMTQADMDGLAYVLAKEVFQYLE
jgi:CubicO group peptidase (beta-lactamase class C family)